MVLTFEEERRIAKVERFLSDLFGTPEPTDHGGRYPHRRLTWRARGRGDLYPQVDSVALVTPALTEEHIPELLAIRGVSAALNGERYIRMRIDADFDAKALGPVLLRAWGPPG